MPGHFEVGYALILCDYFLHKPPSVGNDFLQVVVITCEHACIRTFVLRV
jgi:hypothetical protein